MDVRQQECRRQLHAGRRRFQGPGHGQLEPGGLQRGRHCAHRRRLLAPLAADRRRLEPHPCLRPAARADVFADNIRPQCRQRGLVAASRWHTDAERQACGTSRPQRFSRVLLACPDRVGAGRRVCGVQVCRSPVCRVPAVQAGPRRRVPEQAVARQVREVRRCRRRQGPCLADHRRGGCLGGSRARTLRLLKGRARRRRCRHRAEPAHRRCRRDVLGIGSAVALRRDSSVEPVPDPLARLGRNGRGRRRERVPGTASPRSADGCGEGLRPIHSAAPRRGRTGQCLEPDPG